MQFEEVKANFKLDFALTKFLYQTHGTCELYFTPLVENCLNNDVVSIVKLTIQD